MRGRPPKLTGARRYPSRLRELRQGRGLSQQAAARAAGISTAYYGALERGDKRINSDIAARLAMPLGCSVGDLLDAPRGAAVPLTLAVAAAESAARPADYDLPEPYERVPLGRLASAANCFAAEIFDDSAGADFAPGTILVARRITVPDRIVPVGAKVLVRFYLDFDAGRSRRTHEVLYGILDRNIVGELVLITRSRNPLIPRHALIQSAASGGPGLVERVVPMTPRDTPIVYEPRADDPAEILGVAIYAMGPI